MRARPRARPLRRPSSRTKRAARSARRGRAGGGASTRRTSRRRARRRRGRSSGGAPPDRAPAIYVFFFAGAYFDGHFVDSEPSLATNTPLRSRPVTTTSRPTPNEVRDGPVVDDGRARRRVLRHVAEDEAHAGARVRVAARADDLAHEQHVAVLAREVARLDLRRAGARDRGVDDEDGERRRNGQRDDEPGGTAPHARKDTPRRGVSARRRSRGGPARGSRDRGKANQASPR